jgi:hypothetical protein
MRLRLDQFGPGAREPFGPASTRCSRPAVAEADEFYASITPPAMDTDTAHVMRQALAGMLWSKQYYCSTSTCGCASTTHPLRRARRHGVRNADWFHMVNDDVISMPDTWEYPWYAAWDLAFHTIPLAMVDPDFAKQQLELMLSAVPAPERADPGVRVELQRRQPARARWATSMLYLEESATTRRRATSVPGRGLPEAAAQLHWWVNRKDPTGRNVFEGGFLGLDNIGVFDRSNRCRRGGTLEQADGTAWMAFFSQNMLELASSSREHDPVYEGMASQVRASTSAGSRWRWTGSATARTSCGTTRTGSSTTCCAARRQRPSG